MDIEFTTYSTWTKTEHILKGKRHHSPQTHHHKYTDDMQTIICEVLLNMADGLNTGLSNLAVTNQFSISASMNGG